MSDRESDAPDERPTDDERATNDGQQFDRLPATADEREVEGRATRQEVLEWWDQRFAIPPETFEGYTFWEKGKGKVWILDGEIASPVRIEALGTKFLRTRQEHWKPTTNAVQRFGRPATKNVIELTREQARRFVRGETQEPDWDGDWGYLVVSHELAGDSEPLGVGLYVHGELQSPVPKGRQREL
jgi:NOL1/NOP2/fmu family ribosome biogenesis protein